MLLAGLANTARPEEINRSRMLDLTDARKFVPDRVPLEMESVLVDTARISAIVFPDQKRLAVAPLLTSSYGSEFRSKYQFLLITETRLRLGRFSLTSGMIGIGLDPIETNAAAMNVVTRDFSGGEIERLTLDLGENGPTTRVTLVPKGDKAFELWIGKFMIAGTQR
jgi:hypothetical protein